MEKSVYKIGRLTWYQEELTWAQDKRLLKLIEDATGKVMGDEELTMAGLQHLLVKYDLLGTFLSIILQPKIDVPYILWRIWDFLAWCLFIRRGSFRWVNAKRASNSQLEEIFEDFFLYNRKLMKSLTRFGAALELMADKAAELEKTEEKARAEVKTSHLTGAPKSAN